ncbi:MAG: hypothetical protein A4S09_14150 [Proteobacteria bacterium SG_bin7]|nr:MAG: hypothetical protein A4S09_14150 [Proteobacteria bacterium SG_bin7]
MKLHIPKRRYVTRPVEKKNATTAKSYRIPVPLLDVLSEGANEYGWNPSTFLALLVEEYLNQMTGKRVVKSKVEYSDLQTKTFRLDNTLIAAIAVASKPSGITATDIIVASLEVFKKQ